MQARLKLDIGWSDLASVWPPAWRKRGDLERGIAAHAPAGTVAVAGLSVRSIFQASLMETAAGKPVAMSAVTLEDMATLAQAGGSRVVPMDVDIDSLLPTPVAARRACGEDAGMVVLAHLFGSRGPVGAIAAACAAQGRLIVEDCAQAFDGRLRLSTGADVALYSFGPIKTATALGGAIGLFRDPDLADRVRIRMAEWPVLGNGWFLRRAIKFAALKLIGTPALYGAFLSATEWLSRDSEKFIGSMARGFAGQPIAAAVRHRPPLRLLRLLERRLNTWTAQKDETAFLLERLGQRLVVPGLAARPAKWWLAPVLSPNADALVARLRPQGYDATRGTTSMRALIGDGAEAPKVASRLIASVVYLPKPASRAASCRLAEAVEKALEG